MSTITTEEEKLTSILVALLKREPGLSELMPFYTPFESAKKIKLPGVFIMVKRSEEAIANTGIYELEAEVELRYLVKGTTDERAMTYWRQINECLTGTQLDVFADRLSEFRADFIVHYVEFADTEPSAREGERHFALTLLLGCANL